MPATLTEIRTAGDALPQPLPDDLQRLLGQPDALIWIDVTQPSGDELDRLQRQLDLPPLAVADALQAKQRPRIEEYPNCVVVVAYAVAMADTDRGPRLELHEVTLFIGHHYVVSLREHPLLTAQEVRDRLELPSRPLPTGAEMAHAVLDRIVDGYYSVSEDFESRIEDLDDRVWDGFDQNDLAGAFAMRRDLVHFRRVVAPLREVLNVMVRREGGVLDDAVDERLRDLYDHVVTVYEEIEMSRELLQNVLEGHLSIVSNRMNNVVLKVSAWAAIIAVPTVIASIYGMNFVHMPELHWALGYPIALLIMFAAALGLFVTFKRHDWL